MGIEEKLPAGFLLTTVEQVAGYMRKSSVWPATFGLACCAIEMMAVGTPDYDIARFGMERFSATPRQADLMIVAGRVSQKMAPVVRQVYDQMPEPKWVISMGVCASSGGMFNNYAIVQGVDHIIPVDVYLPGCPPRPEMLLNAIIELHEQIQNCKLGVNRVAAARAAEAAALSATPTHQMNGLLAWATAEQRTSTATARPDADQPSAEPTRRIRPARPTHGRRSPARSSTGDRRASARGSRRRRPTRSWSASAAACSVPADTGDTSGYGGLVSPDPVPRRRRRAPTAATSTRSPTTSSAASSGGAASYAEAVERVVVDRGEMTLFVRREHLLAVARVLRDDPSLRFEMCTGVSGVHYPRRGRPRAARRLPLPVDHPRRPPGPRRGHRPDADPHIPSIVSIYPANDWHERETWDMFGIEFDGHPALTRILMPDDWPGHPQRKDYPLGGIPVEYKGATIPPPDQRRSYS